MDLNILKSTINTLFINLNFKNHKNTKTKMARTKTMAKKSKKSKKKGGRSKKGGRKTAPAKGGVVERKKRRWRPGTVTLR